METPTGDSTPPTHDRAPVAPPSPAAAAAAAAATPQPAGATVDAADEGASVNDASATPAHRPAPPAHEFAHPVASLADRPTPPPPQQQQQEQEQGEGEAPDTATTSPTPTSSIVSDVGAAAVSPTATRTASDGHVAAPVAVPSPLASPKPAPAAAATASPFRGGRGDLLELLEYSWSLVRNRSLPLDRRINAMNDMKDVLECIEKKTDYLLAKSKGAGGVLGYLNAVTSSLSMNEPPPAFMRTTLTHDVLCQWLLQHDVLSELLDPESTHLELVRRAYPILKALSTPVTGAAQAKGALPTVRLTQRHLDQLWDLACMGKHESIEHLVFEVVARLSSVLPLSLMNHIFTRMCDKPFAEYDAIFLTLVYNFTLSTLRPESAAQQHAAQANSSSASASSAERKAAEPTYGIELFWSLLQSAHTHALKPGASKGVNPPAGVGPPVGLSTELITRAQTYLLQLLEMEAAISLRAKYMDRCITNVQCGVLVSQSLHLLLRIVQLYPKKSSSWFSSGSAPTRATILEGLEQKYGLLHLVLHELSHFRSASESSVARSGSSPSPGGFLVEDATSELAQLEMREEFLVFLLTSSSLSLTSAQIDLLWRRLVEQSSDGRVRDSFFAFLIDACDESTKTTTHTDHATRVLSSEVKAHLLHTKLLGLPPAGVSPMAFKCLLRYFIRVQVKAGALAAEAPIATVDQQLGTEFTRILAKHRGSTPIAIKSAGASSALPLSPPALLSSPSEMSLLPALVDYSATSDEDQLSVSPQYEASVLAWTQRVCSTFSVARYSDVRGLKFLWTIVLRHPRVRVARQASLLLNALHQQVAGALRSSAAGVEAQTRMREAHLKTCLASLTRALATTANEESRPPSLASAGASDDLQTKKKVSRCIYLLKTYLHGFSGSKSSSSSSVGPVAGGASSASPLLTIHIRPSREYRLAPFELAVRPDDTIGDLRTRIFRHLSSRNASVALHSMSLVWSNRKLLTSHLGLGQVGVRHGDSVLVERHSNLFQTYQPSAAVYGDPSATIFTSLFFDCLDERAADGARDLEGRERYATPSLAERAVSKEDAARSTARQLHSIDPTLSAIARDPASFDRLFALLAPTSPISASVFEILMLLPMNLQTLRTFLAVSTIAPTQWPALLAVDSMYRLLYSLQAIDEILTGRSQPTLAVQQASGHDARPFDFPAWCQAFIHRGGVDHLVALATDPCWTKASGPATAVPRAIQHETLQSIFSLLHALFTLDPHFPADQLGPPAAAAGVGSARLASAPLPAGTFSQSKQWESLVLRLVSDGILAALLRATTEGADGVAAAGHDNATSVLLAGTRLLVGCVHSVPSTMELFYRQPDRTADLLTGLLLQSTSAAARTQSAQVLFAIFKLTQKQQQQPKPVPAEQLLFWPHLLRRLLQSSALRRHASRSTEFFLLCVSYLDLLCSPSLSPLYREQLQTLELFELVSRLLHAHPSTEEYDSPLLADEYLCGLLHLSRCLVTHRLVGECSVEVARDRLLAHLAYVYRVCLFQTPADDPTQGCKCKTDASRTVAFGLLLELATVEAACFADLLRRINAEPMWREERPPTHWNYDPTLLEKETPNAPVGLKNQGATCYLNSFLQVLFSAPEFRRAILSMRQADAPPSRLQASDSDLASLPPLPDSPTAHGPDQSPGVGSPSAVGALACVDSSRVPLLRELQLLFGHLSWSHQSSFDPLDFCHALKDFDGRPVNIGEQKDVNEFASLLFDQLEQEMKQLAQASDSPERRQANRANQRIIEHSFRGALIHQIRSLDPAECPHTTDREEQYLMISLPVVNKTSLVASLSAFIEGDILDGDNKYLCDQCQKKVAVSKRCCLHADHLPPYLILHLKRFEFDFDKFCKVKVHTRLEFPYKEGDYLNVEPFTATASDEPTTDHPPGFFEYSLVGVLIHGGSAEGGHYVTLCKTERPDRPETMGAPAAADGVASDGSDSSTGGASSSSSSSSSWFEYNDSVVRPFSLSDLPASAFGGVETIATFDRALNTTVTKEVVNIKSAYMLVYQRRYRPTDQDQHQTNTQTATDTEAGPEEADATGEPAALGATAVALPPAASSLPVVGVPGAGSSSSPSPSPSALWSYDRHRVDLRHFPADIRDSVWRGNLAFLADQYTFSLTLTWFVWHLVRLHLPGDRTSQVAAHSTSSRLAVTTAMRADAHQTAWSIPQAVPIAQLAVHFTFDILARSVENASFPLWIDLLYQLFEWDADARRWFLQSLVEDVPATSAGAPPTVQPTRLLQTILFDCPQQIVREAFADLIVFAVAETRADKAERDRYQTDEGADADVAPTKEATPAGATTSSSSSSSVSGSCVTRLLGWFLVAIPSVRHHHRTYKEYWRCFYQLARLGADERQWLLHRGAIRTIVSFYLDGRPMAGFNVTAGYAGEPPKRKHVTSSFWVVQLLALLVRSCSTDSLPALGPSPSQSHRSLCPLDESTRDLLLSGWREPPVSSSSPPPSSGSSSPALSRSLVPWLLSDSQNPSAVCELLVHWCWEQPALSCRLVDLLVQQCVQELVHVADLADYHLVFRVFSALVHLSDSPSSQATRVEYALGELFALLQKVVGRAKIGDARLLHIAVQHVVKWAYERPRVTRWMQAHTKHREWMHRWKETHSEEPGARTHAAGAPTPLAQSTR